MRPRPAAEADAAGAAAVVPAPELAAARLPAMRPKLERAAVDLGGVVAASSRV
jgi:hypothetical protein